MSKSVFENFVHCFGFLMSFSAGGAVHEVRVQCVAFVVSKLAVQIGGEPVVDFVVDGCHNVNRLRPELV